MAASIYATPPPDLIGEDTGLSDSSSSSAVAHNSNEAAPSNILSTDSENLESFNSTGKGIIHYLTS